MEDERIIALYFCRDEQAITATEERYGGYCRSIARNILSVAEDAEECVNDAYHTVWNHVPPDRPNSLRAYLGRLVRNLCISRYRADHAKKRFSGMELLLSELNDCIPAPEQPHAVLERKELARCISAWLRSLREGDRVIFLRRYWYGESVKALAAQEGCTANHMTRRLSALRRALRERLEKEGVTI